MSNYHYNRSLKSNARELRTHSVSKAEKLLWKTTLSKGRTGVKFKRQRPIDKFIVDFFAQELRLVIEIDGSSHLHNAQYDRDRQDRIEGLGCKVIRFAEGEVLTNIDEVSKRIKHTVEILRN